MTVWIIAVLMSTVATAGLLLPLVWRRNRGDNSAAYDIEVYKDQLNQVEDMLTNQYPEDS